MLSYRDLIAAINIAGKKSPDTLNKELVVTKEDTTNNNVFAVACESHSRGKAPVLVLTECSD